MYLTHYALILQYPKEYVYLYNFSQKSMPHSFFEDFYLLRFQNICDLRRYYMHLFQTGKD